MIPKVKSMILPVLFAVLFTEFLSSATPVDTPDDHVALLHAPEPAAVDEAHTAQSRQLRPRDRIAFQEPYSEDIGDEYKLEWDAALQTLHAPKNVQQEEKITAEHQREASEQLDYIDDERRAFNQARNLYNNIEKLKYCNPDKFWATMDRYVKYEKRQLQNLQLIQPQNGRVPSMVNNFIKDNIFFKEREFFEKVHNLMIDYPLLLDSLTKTFLYIRDTRPIRKNEKNIFKHVLKSAIKLDTAKRVLDERAMTDIGRALARAEYMTGEDFLYTLIYSDSVRDILGPRQINSLTHWYATAMIEHQELLKKFGIRPSTERFYQLLINSCAADERRLLRRQRRRRGISNCLLSEEEYREVVKKVEKSGGVKKVVDTEKFLGLLDRVTAEEPAAKRDQLLKLGAALSEDPGVLLEGDYVTEFRDAVKVLDQAVPSHVLDIPRSQLPENRFGEAGQALESHKLPLNHPSPGEISSYPADRISAHPHGIFHEPIQIHDPIIHPEKFGGVNFRVPMSEFRGQIKPLSVPEITRPIEITPVKTFPMPEVRLPMPKSRFPMIGRG